MSHLDHDPRFYWWSTLLRRAEVSLFTENDECHTELALPNAQNADRSALTRSLCNKAGKSLPATLATRTLLLKCGRDNLQVGTGSLSLPIDGACQITNPFNTPEILVSVTPCPGYGVSVKEEEQRRLVPSQRWTVPLEMWDDIREYATNQSFYSIPDLIAYCEEDIQEILPDPEYFDAIVLPRSERTLNAIRERLCFPDFDAPYPHVPLLFLQPYDMGTPKFHPTLFALMTKFERNCCQFGFFEVRSITYGRVIAIRHPARLVFARNEATGESVQYWYDEPRICIAKVLAEKETSVDVIEHVAKKNAEFLFEFAMREAADDVLSQFL